MAKGFKRLLVMFLCMALVMGDSAITSLASEVTNSDYSQIEDDVNEYSESYSFDEETSEIDEDNITSEVDNIILSESEAEQYDQDDSQVEESEIIIDDAVEENMNVTDQIDFSRFAGGSGTETDPVLIATADQFMYYVELGDVYNSPSYYKLVNDIVLNNDLNNPNRIINPTNQGSHLDGGNHKVSNIYIEKNYIFKYISGLKNITFSNVYINSTGGALFGNVVLSKYEIRNVSLEGDFIFAESTISTGTSSSMLIGTNSGTISDCYSSAKCLNSNNKYFGVFAGTNENLGLIENCSFEGEITSKSSKVGGICGYNNGATIQNCTVSENAKFIYMGSSEMGAIVGENTTNGLVESCSNYGNIIIGDKTKSPMISGIIGKNNGTVNDCINYGNIGGDEYIGYASGICNKVDTKGTIYNCINKGTISANYASGIATQNYGSISKCQNEGCIDGKYDSSGIVHSNSHYLELCINKGTFGNSESGRTAGIVGSLSSSYSALVSNKIFSEVVACTNEADMIDKWSSAGIVYSASGRYVAISGCVNKGKIKGTNCHGIVGQISNSSDNDSITVIDNNINYGDIEVKNGSGFATGIVGSLSEGNVVISDCSNYGNILGGGGFAAGILEHNNSKSKLVIERCFNNGNITNARRAGGIAGSLYNGTIEKCYNSATISSGNNTGYANLGGLIGEIRRIGTINIKDCFNSGMVDNSKLQCNQSCTGGIIGVISLNMHDAEEGYCKIFNCYNAAPVKFNNGEFSRCGALFGELTHNTNDSVDNFELCGLYYINRGFGGIGENNWNGRNVEDYTDVIISCVESEFRSKDTFKEFDFEDVWFINSENEEYPYPALKEVGAIGVSIDYSSMKGVWNNISWKIDNGILYVSGEGKIDDNPIPGNAPWFEFRDEINEVIIGEGITHIGRSNFSYMNMLRKVLFPSTLEEIGIGAFRGCEKIQILDIPGNVLSISENAFAKCKKLQQVNISEGVQAIGRSVFSDCDELKEIYLPSTISDIMYISKSITCVHFNGTKDEWNNIKKDPGFDRMLKNNPAVVAFTDGTREGFFHYLKSDDDGTAGVFEVEWDNNLFFGDFKKYNHELALLSLKAEMSAFGIGREGKDKDKNIKSFMSEMGLKYEEDYSEYPDWDKNDYDTIGYAIGRGTIINGAGKESSLILVALRGAGYGYEWGGNFNVGFNENHKGFDVAADKVKDALDDFIKFNSDELCDDIKIWVVGYSRGAAVANLVTAKIDDSYDDYEKNVNAVGYCFECPNNTTSKNIDYEKYKNIHNIVNPQDFVPLLAPSYIWKFNRYGSTYYFPSKLNSDDYINYIERVKVNYKNIIGKDYLTKDNYFSFVQQELVFNTMIKTFVDLVGNRVDFVTICQSQIQSLIINAMVDSNFKVGVWDILSTIFARAADVIIKAKNIPLYAEYKGIMIGADTLAILIEAAGETISLEGKTQEDVIELIMPAINTNHFPEFTLAWMETLDGSIVNNKKFNKHIINCPVDVVVKNGNGVVVAQIINNVVSEIDDGLVAFVDKDGQKVIFTPGDANFDIDIIPYQDGTMSYIADSFEDVYTEPEKIEIYNDLPLVKDNDYIVHYENGESDVYTPDGKQIEPDLVKMEGEYSYYDIELKSVGAGSATGGGRYIEAEYAKVVAEPFLTSEDFLGWYIDDELISKELEYRFPVKQDTVIEARFDDANGKMYVKELEESYKYIGKAIIPDIQVYDGMNLLAKGVDYTVTYKNNVNVNDASDIAKAPTITVKGKGNYDQSETLTFKIEAADISGADFSSDEIAVVTTSKEQKPKPVIKWNGKAVPATGYTYQYFVADENGNPIGEALISVKDAGDYVIVCNGQGNFTGTRNVKLTVTSTKKLASKLSVASIPSKPYTGFAIMPEIVVKDGKTLLTKDKDYSVRYLNNVAVGTASVVITGTGNYVGTKTVTFKITGTAITKATVEGISPSVTYTGNDITFDDIKLYIKATKTTGQIDLEEDVDYIVSYQKNRSVGTATVVFTGINGYTGTLKKTFKIAQIKQTNEPERIVVELDSDSVVYSKGGAKPAVTVKFTNGDGTESILAEKTDYTLAYSKNTAVNDCSNVSNMPTVKVTLKGNWSGSITKNFKIIPKDILLTKAKATDKVYQNKKNIYATTFVLTDTDGKNLAAGKDYDKTFVYKYVRDTEVLCDGNPVVRGANEPVSVNDIIPAETVIRVTASAKEGSNYTGSVSTTYRIAKSSIGSAKVTIPKQIYTGREVYVDGSEMEVKIGKTALEYGTDFEIVPGSFENNIKKGNASVVIRGIGNYGASKKVTYVIKAKGIQWWWKKLFALSSKKLSLISADSGTGIISVRDEIKIKEGELEKVQFIVWTTLGGKDDLRSEITDDFQLSSDGVATVDYSFNASEHRNESGEYNVKAIAIGKNGDKIEAGEIKVNATINGEIIPENPTPTITPTPTVTPDDPTPTIAPGEPTPTDTPSPTPSENEPTATPTPDVSSGVRFTYSVNADGQTATITGYEGTASGDLIIPSSIDGYSVTAIGEEAFESSGFAGRLSIPQGVSTIGKSAFENCSGLRGDLALPNTVSSIGEYAFYGCSGFTGNLVIPKGVTEIPSCAFVDCSGFNGTLVLPDTITTIGDYAFLNCNRLAGTLNLPESVTTIKERAFNLCSNFTGNLIIPNSVTLIGNGAFHSCLGLEGLVLSENITEINDFAFGCCGFTGSINIPSKVKIIGKSSFYGCSGLQGVFIPNSVTTIKDYVFYGCYGLESVTIPRSVTSIGLDLFVDTELKYVINNSDTQIIFANNDQYWYDSLGNRIYSIANGTAYGGTKDGPY